MEQVFRITFRTGVPSGKHWCVDCEDIEEAAEFDDLVGKFKASAKPFHGSTKSIVRLVVGDQVGEPQTIKKLFWFAMNKYSEAVAKTGAYGAKNQKVPKELEIEVMDCRAAIAIAVASGGKRCVFDTT